MKQLLLSGFLIFSVSLHAQQPCIEKPNQNTDELTNDSPLMYNEMERGKDFNGSYTVRGLKIGGGMTGGLFYSGLGKLNDSRQELTSDAHWNHNQAGGFAELIYQPKTNGRVSFGFSATWNQMWKQKISYVTDPNPTEQQTLPFEPQASPETLYALSWNVEKKMKLNNFLFFSDITVLTLNQKLDLFIRPEIGISNARNILTIKTKDTCNCDYTAYHSNDRKTTFTGGLGVGVNFHHAFIEIKSMLGYRVYNMTGMASREDFSQWRAVFDKESYDFKGGKPGSDLFTIDKPENAPQISRRTGMLYLQVGLYLNLGEMLN